MDALAFSTVRCVNFVRTAMMQKKALLCDRPFMWSLPISQGYKSQDYIAFPVDNMLLGMGSIKGPF